MFDGHGGVDAAIYASIHLHVNLVRQEMFPHDPAEALCRAFRVTDERFVQKAAREVCGFHADSSHDNASWVHLFCGWRAILDFLFCDRHYLKLSSKLRSWHAVLDPIVGLIPSLGIDLVGCYDVL